MRRDKALLHVKSFLLEHLFPLQVGFYKLVILWDISHVHS